MPKGRRVAEVPVLEAQSPEGQQPEDARKDCRVTGLGVGGGSLAELLSPQAQPLWLSSRVAAVPPRKGEHDARGAGLGMLRPLPQPQ